MFEEFISEAFGCFSMGDELRRGHGRQLGVVFERALRDGLRRGEAEIEREQPARRERQAQRSRDEGEPREELPLSNWRGSVLECSSPLELCGVRWTFESAGGPAHSRTLS